MSARPKKYHHGNLSEALLDQASEALEELGLEGLSLREVARRTEVSHNAVYRHFASKEALLTAIARRGFQRLLGQLRRGAGPFSGAPRTQLFAGARVYLQFAHAFPHHFQVMFRRETGAPSPELAREARELFDLLLEIILEGQAQGSFLQGDAYTATLLYWSGIHGLAELFVASKIPAPNRGSHTADALSRSLVEGLLRGIEAHQEEADIQ